MGTLLLYFLFFIIRIICKDNTLGKFFCSCRLFSASQLRTVVNSVLVGVLFFQLEWNVSVLDCFGVLFRGCTVHIYIYIYIYSTKIIQIQDKLIINYAIQTQCQTNIILKFKIFLNSQD